MKPSNEEHDPYALYVRAHRHHSMMWVGPEPTDVIGQLALSIGKQDGCASSRLGARVVLKSRNELMAEIAKLNGTDHMNPMKTLVLELLDVAEGMRDFLRSGSDLHNNNDIDSVDDLRDRLKDAQARVKEMKIE
jgi:hypothetical protein